MAVAERDAAQSTSHDGKPLRGGVLEVQLPEMEGAGRDEPAHTKTFEPKKLRMRMRLHVKMVDGEMTMLEATCSREGFASGERLSLQRDC